MRQTGSAGIPIRNAIGRRVLDVEIASGARRLLHHRDGFPLAGQGIEEFQLLGETAHGPGQPARPGAEGGVALLRVGAAVIAVVGIEDALVGHTAADVVAVAAFAVEHGILCGGPRVLDRAVEQRNPAVSLAHQGVAQQVAQGQSAQGADGIDEQGVRPVEGVNISAAIRTWRPARGLHGARDLQRQLVKAPLPSIFGNAPFGHEPQQIAVGADVVETVVVHSDMADVRRHERNRALTADLQKLPSPVASNWRIAPPNWKPRVHSVHPRLVYFPLTVKTGEPCDGSHSFSMERSLAAESSKRRRTLSASAAGVSPDGVWTMAIAALELRRWNRNRRAGLR